jgi:hypothetical protein
VYYCLNKLGLTVYAGFNPITGRDDWGLKCQCACLEKFNSGKTAQKKAAETCAMCCLMFEQQDQNTQDVINFCTSLGTVASNIDQKYQDELIDIIGLTEEKKWYDKIRDWWNNLKKGVKKCCKK